MAGRNGMRSKPPGIKSMSRAQKTKIASKSGKGSLSAKDKKTLRNANIRESVPTKVGGVKPKSVPTKVGGVKPKSVPAKSYVGSGGAKPPVVSKGGALAKGGSKLPVKTQTRRGVKNMGNAHVVPKKGISGTFAKGVSKASRVSGVGAVVAGVTALAVGAASDKNIYGDRLTKTKTTQMPLPKSKPGLSAKANAKMESATKPKKKAKKTAPTTTPKVSLPQKSVATSGYEPQKSAATSRTKTRLESGYKNPTKAPAGTPVPTKSNGKPFSKNTQKSLTWLQNGDW
jgi:hypothetical protein